MTFLRTIGLVAALSLGMLLPYLPGRFDGSATTLSFLIQVSSYASLLFVPPGVAWMLAPRRVRTWRKLTLWIAALVAVVATFVAVADNQLAFGVLVGVIAVSVLRRLRRWTATDIDGNGGRASPVALGIVLAPILLVAFMIMVLPRAAARSRDRAIRHSAPFISELESFHRRRGHYPVSLQSLNRDIPTGVIGIERFHYEPNGDGYNLYFVRQSIALDAKEVVMYNPRDEHRFTSHERDILQYDGEQVDVRRGDRRRTRLAHAHWLSILFD
ncbi:MAG TPA: hypothetical protein VFZ21_25195 [Gemmatimonadaceae bacterium]|nr:hypothetical protein [Gemmatimonadaceae bacterium]